MKLLRHGPIGKERPGLLDDEECIRDLSAHIDDIAGEALSPSGLRRLAEINPSRLPMVAKTQRLGPPVSGMKNLVCVGLNYADHAAEMGSPIPDEPILFLKALGSLSGPYDDIILPAHSDKVDWETELGVVIGALARDVSENNALDYVAGYVLANDVSERGWQYDRGGSWDKGKGFDTSAPIGPWLVTKDEVPDTANLPVQLDLDGVRMQDGNTASMIFRVPFLVSYISRFITLHPGDVIFTGTPPGVGRGRKPPLFLKPGQVLSFGIAGLGEQRHRTVTAEQAYLANSG